MTLTEEGKASVPLARRIFAEPEEELSRRIGSDVFEGLSRAMQADWGSPPRV